MGNSENKNPMKVLSGSCKERLQGDAPRERADDLPAFPKGNLMAAGLGS